MKTKTNHNFPVCLLCVTEIWETSIYMASVKQIRLNSHVFPFAQKLNSLCQVSHFHISAGFSILHLIEHPKIAGGHFLDFEHTLELHIILGIRNYVIN